MLPFSLHPVCSHCWITLLSTIHILSCAYPVIYNGMLYCAEFSCKLKKKNSLAAFFCWYCVLSPSTVSLNFQVFTGNLLCCCKPLALGFLAFAVLFCFVLFQITVLDVAPFAAVMNCSDNNCYFVEAFYCQPLHASLWKWESEFSFFPCAHFTNELSDRAHMLYATGPRFTPWLLQLRRGKGPI